MHRSASGVLRIQSENWLVMCVSCANSSQWLSDRLAAPVREIAHCWRCCVACEAGVFNTDQMQ